MKETDTKQSEASENQPEEGAAIAPVSGSGTAGQIPKWLNASTQGDSNISEDSVGGINISTSLGVKGEIATAFGLRFADGTTQRTAAAPTVVHDETLTGDGSSGNPLGVAVPLELDLRTGSSRIPALIINNHLDGGVGADINGGNGSNFGGPGLRANGGRGERLDGGFGVAGQGGDSNGGGPGSGVIGIGGRGATGGIGVRAEGGYSTGSFSLGGTGIRALAGQANSAGGGFNGRAGHFYGAVVIENIFGGRGNLSVAGDLNVTGFKGFKIDHPLDPENKYLYHAAIESPEVLNVYSGNITTDESGQAVVQLPEWFEAINKDFRYQLTVIGSFAQAIVASKINHNRFTIKSNAANVEVSWQVTGVRSDPVMVKQPFKAEEDKPESERRFYLSPDAYNQPEERGSGWAINPELMRELKEAREKRPE